MDFGRLAQLGNREKAILGAVILLAFVYGSHLFLIQPQRNNLRARQKELVSKERLLKAARERSKNVGKLEEEHRKLEAKLEEVDKKLLTDEEAKSLLWELPGLIEATKTQVPVFKPLYRSKKELVPRRAKGSRRRGELRRVRLMMLPVEMNLIGSYATICDLVSEFKWREPSLTVETINVEADQANLPQLEVNLRLNLHIVTEQTLKPKRGQRRR